MNIQPVYFVQPQFSAPTVQSNAWQTDLMDCCSDCGVCLCGTFCFYCLGCEIASDMNECCCCGSGVPMRTLYRTRYGIPGSICSDYCTILWCSACSLCQIKRDIKRRKEMGIF